MTENKVDPSISTTVRGVRRVSEPNTTLSDDSEQSLSEGECEYKSSNNDEIKSGTSRKRIMIDESKLDGDELHRLETRREYNRRCAARARKRSKDLVSTLQKQVDELAHDKAELKRLNDVMKAQLELLEHQNRTLIMQQMTGQVAMGQIPSLHGRQGVGGYGAYDGGNNTLPNFLGLSSMHGQPGSGPGFHWRGLH